MIGAKNYETVFKFVTVMPRKLVASFFPDTVHKHKTTLQTSELNNPIIRPNWPSSIVADAVD